jgi:hypothetical protein
MCILCTDVLIRILGELDKEIATTGTVKRSLPELMCGDFLGCAVSSAKEEGGVDINGEL